MKHLRSPSASSPFTQHSTFKNPGKRLAVSCKRPVNQATDSRIINAALPLVPFSQHQQPAGRAVATEKPPGV